MINKRKEGKRKEMVFDQVYIFEDQKTFRKNGIKSVSIETLKGSLLCKKDINVWIPPPGVTNEFNRKVLDILKKDFSFRISTSIFIPICDNLLIFGSESTGINIPVAKYIIGDLYANAVYIPQTRDDNGRKGKNSNASFNLVHSILMSLMILKTPSFKYPYLSKGDISFWFPNWSPSGARKGNEITTRMIGAMSRDIVLSLGEKKIYWDYRAAPGEKGSQNNVAITVSQGLLKKEMIDVSFPSFDSQDVLLIDIVIHPSDSIEDWERFPSIYLGEKKKILVSVIDSESRGLYQPPNSIRLDYGSSPSTAMVWFLGLL